MSNLARDTWQELKPVRKVDRLNKKITLAGGTWNCGRAHKCISFNVNTIYSPSFNLDFAISRAAFTVEFWIKPLMFDNSIQTILKYGSTTPQFQFLMYQGYVYLRLFKAGIAYELGSIYRPVPYEWNHVMLRYDGIKGYLYVNTLEGGNIAVAANLDAPVGTCKVGLDSLGIENLRAQLGEIRIWNGLRTLDELYNYYNKPRINNGTDITNLAYYFKCNGTLLDGNGNEIEQIRGNYPIYWNPIGSSSAFFLADDAPPLIYGASFVVAKYAISMGAPSSLRFPVIAPANADHALVVCWLDDNGVYQRRYLYTVAGVDFDSTVTAYSGEKLAEDYSLEVWNIDGNETVTLAETTLYVSLTSAPTLASDITNLDAVDAPAANSALAEPFPWVFPLTFNTQQTFN